MSQRAIIQVLAFIGLLVLLNIIFSMIGIHEHIDILGSVILTVVLSIGMTLLFSRRGTKH